jgi:hypothetical protein
MTYVYTQVFAPKTTSWLIRHPISLTHTFRNRQTQTPTNEEKPQAKLTVLLLLALTFGVLLLLFSRLFPAVALISYLYRFEKIHDGDYALFMCEYLYYRCVTPPPPPTHCFSILPSHLRESSPPQNTVLKEVTLVVSVG